MDYTTFAGLQAAILDELDRTDITTAQLNSFIRIAERRTYRALRIPSMEVKSPIPVLPIDELEPDSVPHIEIPERWIETITMTTGDGIAVEYITQQKFRQLTRNASGALRFFTREGQRFLLWPSNFAGEHVNLYYYARPEFGDADANPEPPIYGEIGEALFYGSVSEAWRFQRDNEKYAYYRELFAETLQLLQDQHKQSDVSGSTMITKNPYL